MQLAIIGVGHVGSIAAYTASLRGLVDEIYLYDIDKKKSGAQVADLEDGNEFYPHPVKFYQADLEDVAKCDTILISSGGIQEDANRLHEFASNKEDVADYVPKIMKAGFKGIFLVVSNPCDIISYCVWKYSGLSKERVIGSGTYLDSIRCQGIIARKLKLDPRCVEAKVLGEHGDSQFVPWSQVRIGGQALGEFLFNSGLQESFFDKEAIEKESLYRGHEIFLGRGATQFGIGNTVCDILAAIKYDQKTILPVSTLLEGQYKISDIFISTPAIIGRNGVEKIIEWDLREDEKRRFKESAKIIEGYVKKL